MDGQHQAWLDTEWTVRLGGASPAPAAWSRLVGDVSIPHTYMSSHHGLSALLWLVHAIFSDQSPVGNGMHPPCPALSKHLNPATRSLQVCLFAARCPPSPVSVFFNYVFFRTLWPKNRSHRHINFSTSKHTQSCPIPFCLFSSPPMTPRAVLDWHNIKVRMHRHASCHHMSSPMIHSRVGLCTKK